ncbi:MAG: hypothetical protein GKR86_07815 [Ilumatobacter sp.]|nr:hypothetical protein [Ilumatobacter sp.]
MQPDPAAPTAGAATLTPMLEMRGITKRFPGVVANDGVDLSVLPGQVHTLLGVLLCVCAHFRLLPWKLSVPSDCHVPDRLSAR